MKPYVIIKILFVIFFIFQGNYSFAQYKKDGSPDMRYKANKELFGTKSPASKYSQPKQERNYNNGGQFRLQKGYRRKNGTYVDSHYKTSSDNNKNNNKKGWFLK